MGKEINRLLRAADEVDAIENELQKVKLENAKMRGSSQTTMQMNSV